MTPHQTQNQSPSQKPTGGNTNRVNDWRPDRDLNPGRSLDRAA